MIAVLAGGALWWAWRGGWTGELRPEGSREEGVSVSASRRDGRPVGEMAAARDGVHGAVRGSDAAAAGAGQRRDDGDGEGDAAVWELPLAFRRPGRRTLGDWWTEVEAGLVRGAGARERDVRLEGALAELLVWAARQEVGPVLAWLEAKPAGELRETSVAWMLRQWSERDPAAAWAWAEAHPAGPADTRRAYAAFEGYTAMQPEEARAILVQPEWAGHRDELGRIALRHAEAQGREGEMRAWIAALPEGAVREGLLVAAVQQWAGRDFAEAAAWVAEVATEAEFDVALGGVVHAVASTHPAQAAELARALPASAGVGRDHLADVVYLWARQDVAAAAAWLERQAPMHQSDAAVGRLIEALVSYDRAAARRWTTRVRDAAERQRLESLVTGR